MSDNKVLMHIVENKSNRALRKTRVMAVPRVGDELRLDLGKGQAFYKVVIAVWVFDEPEAYGQRVNLGVESIE